MDNNWYGYGYCRQDESKEHGEVPFVAAATTPFAAGAHLANLTFFQLNYRNEVMKTPTTTTAARAPMSAQGLFLEQ